MLLLLLHFGSTAALFYKINPLASTHRKRKSTRPKLLPTRLKLLPALIGKPKFSRSYRELRQRARSANSAHRRHRHPLCTLYPLDINDYFITNFIWSCYQYCHLRFVGEPVGIITEYPNAALLPYMWETPSTRTREDRQEGLGDGVLLCRLTCLVGIHAKHGILVASLVGV